MKHIAFDLDGVLVDGLNLHKKCFIQAWNYWVNDTPIDEYFHDKHLASRNTKQKIENLVSLGYGKKYKFEDLLHNVSSMKQKLTIENIEEINATVPWLLDLISKLRDEGRKIALVSNSIRTTCEITLKNIGILHLFDTIVASDDFDVLLNKPNPLPYQVAAERLDKSVHDFVAIEDSVIGLRAAKNAGCWTYVVVNPTYDLEITKFKSWLNIIDAA
jgi:HAD superfamily hydrolase (TIGR01509 family)